MMIYGWVRVDAGNVLEVIYFSATAGAELDRSSIMINSKLRSQDWLLYFECLSVKAAAGESPAPKTPKYLERSLNECRLALPRLQPFMNEKPHSRRSQIGFSCVGGEER